MVYGFIYCSQKFTLDLVIDEVPCWYVDMYWLADCLANFEVS